MDINQNILTALVSVTVIVIVFVFIYSREDVTESVAPVEITTATTTPILGAVYINNPTSVEEDIDAEWVKYTNEELGFEMEHPKDLSVEIKSMIGDGKKFILDLIKNASTTDISLGFDSQSFAMILPAKKSGEKLTYTEDRVMKSVRFFPKKDASIVLMSQNDGEIYYVGNSIDILWRAEGIKSLEIVLESYINSELVKIGSIAKSVDPAKTKHSWVVGDMYDIQTGEKKVFKPTLSSYIIRIEDPNTGKFVRSRVPFTII